MANANRVYLEKKLAGRKLALVQDIGVVGL